MVTIAGPNKSKYSTRIGCKATQSNTKCRSSPTECEAQYVQRRRCLGTPDRLPRTIGKEWQPILNRKKTLIHRELNPSSWPQRMPIYAVIGTLFWALPGDVLAAPASALCGWKGVIYLSLSPSFSLSLPHIKILLFSASFCFSYPSSFYNFVLLRTNYEVIVLKNKVCSSCFTSSDACLLSFGSHNSAFLLPALFLLLVLTAFRGLGVGWGLCRLPLPAVSRLAMRACLAVSVPPGLSVLVPRLASRVTLAVRADARDAVYVSIMQYRQHVYI